MTASLDDGFALPPIEAFASKINDKTKAILLCNQAIHGYGLCP